MRIEELSVGDWVATELAKLAIEGNDIATAFVEQIKKPIQIVSILGDEELVFGRTDELDGFATIYLKAEHIEPIPLTAEILEKNEFESTTNPNVFLLTDSPNMLYVDINSGMTFVNYIKSECFLTASDVKYVHQLQHALRLAGIDKEIEL